MTRTTALAWKEWHDARPYLWVGLGVFLGLPLVGLAEQYAQRGRGELLTTPWVTALGGVLAVFVGVGVTAPERRPKLEDFWRSRPIRVGPWLAVKYAVALAVVLACGTVPIAASMLADRRAASFDAAVLTLYPFYLTAIFSLAFLAGCLVPRTSHAATLAVAAMLLVYAAPLVLPPLSWLTWPDVGAIGRTSWARGGRLDTPTPRGPRLRFAGGMTAIATVAAGVAIVGVARGWRVDSGRRTMYGVVAAALLLLFASAAFQLGTNLPVRATAELPADERITSIEPASDGVGYVVYTERGDPYDPVTHVWKGEPTPLCHRVGVGPAELSVGPTEPQTATSHPADWYDAVEVKSTRYALDGTLVDERAGTMAISLTWGAWPYDSDGARPHRLELFEQSRRARAGWLFVAGDRLYLLGDHLMTFDVSRPNEPRLLSDRRPTTGLPYPYEIAKELGADAGGFRVGLVPVPELSVADRVRATLGVPRYGTAFDGVHLCLGGSGGVTGYRLARVDGDVAVFEPIGRYEPTLLQRTLAGTYVGRMTLGDHGLLYVDESSGDRRRGTFASGTRVIDTDGPSGMTPIGHFAVPGGALARPLPDGRCLSGGGHRLWLVGRPRR